MVHNKEECRGVQRNAPLSKFNFVVANSGVACICSQAELRLFWFITKNEERGAEECSHMKIQFLEPQICYFPTPGLSRTADRKTYVCKEVQMIYLPCKQSTSKVHLLCVLCYLKN